MATACLVFILWTSWVGEVRNEWQPGETYETLAACQAEMKYRRQVEEKRQTQITARIDKEKREATEFEKAMLTRDFTCYPHQFDPRGK